jgi:hypothetical protein
MQSQAFKSQFNDNGSTDHNYLGVVAAWSTGSPQSLPVHDLSPDGDKLKLAKGSRPQAVLQR